MTEKERGQVPSPSFPSSPLPSHGLPPAPSGSRDSRPPSLTPLAPHALTGFSTSPCFPLRSVLILVCGGQGQAPAGCRARAAEMGWGETAPRPPPPLETNIPATPAAPDLTSESPQDPPFFPAASPCSSLLWQHHGGDSIPCPLRS